MEWTDDTALRGRARRAYELGRLRRAARAAFGVAPMLALSLVVYQQALVTVLAGAALLLLAVGFGWWGQAPGRAVWPGLLAGSAPLVLPFALRASGYCCIGGVCWSVCMLGCIAGGAFAGAALGIASSAESEQRWQFLASATSLAAIAGVLGCALVGAAGITGMALAIVLSSLPLAALAQRRSMA
jgi:hypothetical protein